MVPLEGQIVHSRLSKYARMVLRLVNEGMRPGHAIELVARTYRVPQELLTEELHEVLHVG